MWMIYHEKSEFWHREFLIIQEAINGELRKSPMSKFYKNSVDKRDSNVNSKCAKDENNLTTGFFLNKQKPLFKPCF